MWERNRIEDTFGFGVVLSDATEGILAEADWATHAAMAEAMHRWGDIDVHIGGEVITSGGHGFCGISRKVLLEILSDRARELGADLRELTEAPPVEELLKTHDLVVAADGVNSAVREARASQFGATVDLRPNRFVWLGTSRPFPAFSFSFQQNAHGLWRAHAYQYAEGQSTFIVETTDAAWRAAGLEGKRRGGDDRATARRCSRRSWRATGWSPTAPSGGSSRRSGASAGHDGRLVLLGDAAHTAHFSVGSGTKLAMEDAIALAKVLQGATDVAAALATYEAERRPGVESVQRAAQASLEWFEATERYDDLEPLQFAFSLLTRSLRITHENLRARDPAFVERVERWFADQAGVQAGGREAEPPALPHPVHAARAAAGQPHRGLADVPVLGRGRRAERLAPAAPRQPGHRRRGARDDRDDRREPRGADHAGLHRACTADEQVAAWRRIVDFVPAHAPETKIGMQLGARGPEGVRRGSSWEGDNEPLARGRRGRSCRRRPFRGSRRTRCRAR